jgi:hypothetical protein
MNQKSIKKEYDVVIEKNIMVKMRDGTKLATDLYRPAFHGEPITDRLPTILQRTPYNKESPLRVKGLGEWYSSRGYNVVIQDFRGRFNSEGTFYKYSDMGEDGYDTVEWIAEQKWSNKKIGTIGTSFMAHAQIALACKSPPHLSTMIINQGGFSNAFFSSCRHMGALELRQMTWAFSAAVNSVEADEDPVIRAALEEVDPADYLDPMLGNLKEGQSPLRHVPGYEKFYFDLLTNAIYDGYWKRIGLCAEKYLEQVPDIPVLLLGGWYDSYTRTTSELYDGLSRIKKGPIRLIFGPWVHGWDSLKKTYSGEVDFGPDSSIKGTCIASTPDELAIMWFDFYLKGIDNGIGKMPQVKVFIMGGGTGVRTPDDRMSHGGIWRDEQSWPLDMAECTRYYLHKGGNLSLEPPRSGVEPSTYTFDPRNPVPTLGGNISSAGGIMEPGAFNQVERPGVLGCKPPYLPLSSRDDVLVFQTPRLIGDVEVTGPISARLWISSSAPDTDFTLKLIDQYPPSRDYPDGFAMNLTDTIYRARFHSSWSNPTLLEKGKIYLLDMISYPTSNQFKAGHRIRVDISSSNFPRFDINPNSGEPLGRNRMFQNAHQKIYHDSEYPSNILLPVIP